jgi:predicted Zn-dependent protease
VTASTRTLTLCLIVRDEERMLAGCLESVHTLADEILVVDTGSKDATVEIALAHGARVVSTPWTDDFAAARNVGLEHLRTDWVLWLDADERLAPESRSVLRRLMDTEAEDAPPTVYLPLILNVDAAGQSLGADHMPRLWRHRPVLRFTGRIHERVGEGVPHLKQVYQDDLRIVHLGYDPAYARERGKNERNVRLLELELTEKPNDPSLLFYRAKESYAAGRDEEAARDFQRVIREAPGMNFALSAYVFAVECLRSVGRAEEALALAMKGLAGAPDYAELWYAAGQASLDADRPIQAEAQFREAQKPSKGFALVAFSDPDIHAFRAEVGIGQALRMQQKLADAARVWTAARERVPVGPDRVRLDLDLISVHLGLGDEAVAWQLLVPLLDAAPEDAVGPLLEFIELYLQMLGPEKAWSFYVDAVTVHPSMLRQLPIVSAGIELADLLGESTRLAELLQIAVHLGSQVPQHYLLLARFMDARGETAAAEAARRAARRLQSDGV